MPTKDTLYSFQKSKVQSYGVAKILVYIESVEMPISFQIVDCAKDEWVILGKQWIFEHQCMLNYATMCISSTIGAH